MKVLPQNFLTSSGAMSKGGVVSILVYGQNNGLCLEVVRKAISDNGESAIVVNMNWQDVEKKPDILLDEMFNQSLFGEKKVVVVSQVSSKIYPLIDEALKHPMFNSEACFLILHANELEASAKLRYVYENEEKLYSIACYPDDARSLKAAAVDFFKKKGILFEPSLVDNIIENFGGERGVLMNELEKFDIYLGGRKEFTQEDVMRVFFDEKESGVSEFVDYFCLKKKSDAVVSLEKLIESEYNTVMIIRSLIHHLIALRDVVAQTLRGVDIESAMREKRFFFKRIPAIRNQLRLLKFEELEGLLFKSLLVEIRLKMKSSQSEFCLFCLKSLISSL